MNKRGHVINGVLFGAGVGFVLQPTLNLGLPQSMIAVGVPIVLGTLLPDIDTAFGSHRKTFHNIVFLAAFIAFPLYFGNLQYVWLGILSHYVLDLLGTKRGLALLYPLSHEFELPIGVTVDSPLAPVVTLLVTGVELALVVGLLTVMPDLVGLSAPPLAGI